MNYKLIPFPSCATHEEPLLFQVSSLLALYEKTREVLLQMHFLLHPVSQGFP